MLPCSEPFVLIDKTPKRTAEHCGNCSINSYMAVWHQEGELWHCISSRLRYNDTAGQSVTPMRCVSKNSHPALFSTFSLPSSVSPSPHSGAAGHRVDHLSGQVQRADLRGPLLLHLGLRLRLGRHHPVHRLRHPLLLPAALRGRADWHGQDQVHLLVQLEAPPATTSCTDRRTLERCIGSLQIWFWQHLESRLLSSIVQSCATTGFTGSGMIWDFYII